jgi:hypothetical protein
VPTSTPTPTPTPTATPTVIPTATPVPLVDLVDVEIHIEKSPSRPNAKILTVFTNNSDKWVEVSFEMHALVDGMSLSDNKLNLAIGGAGYDPWQGHLVPPNSQTVAAYTKDIAGYDFDDIVCTTHDKRVEVSPWDGASELECPVGAVGADLEILGIIDRGLQTGNLINRTSKDMTVLQYSALRQPLPWYQWWLESFVIEGEVVQYYDERMIVETFVASNSVLENAFTPGAFSNPTTDGVSLPGATQIPWSERCAHAEYRYIPFVDLHTFRSEKFGYWDRQW